MDKLPDITGSITPTNSSDVPARQAANSRSVSRPRPDAASLRQALAERMTSSEALEAVSGILACYEYGVRDNSYIGALASALMYFPRQVALQCADPLCGIARAHPERAPNVGHVIAWCERAQAPLFMQLYEAKREPERVDRSERPTLEQIQHKLPDFMKQEKERKVARFRASFPDPESHEKDRNLRASPHLIRAMKEREELEAARRRLDDPPHWSQS